MSNIEFKVLKSGNIPFLNPNKRILPLYDNTFMNYAFVGNVEKKHGLMLFRTTNPIEKNTWVGTELITLDREFVAFLWGTFNDTSVLIRRYPQKPPLRLGYNMNTPMKFGVYKGKEIGVVYSIDSDYIAWCIKNIDSFFIIDLEEIMEFGTISKRSSIDMEAISVACLPGLNKVVDCFESIQDIAHIIGVGNIDHKLAVEVIEFNERKRFELSR